MEPVLTLQEAARYLRVAPITLYRWARRGAVPVAKLGRSWRFHPNDLEKWFREGTPSFDQPFDKNPDLFRHLSSRETRGVLKFIENLKSRYPSRLKQVILYGSRARGDFKADSDIDLLIIFSKVKEEMVKLKKEVSHQTSSFNLKEDLKLQPLVMMEGEWQNASFRSFLLVEKIQQEGKVIYRQ